MSFRGTASTGVAIALTLSACGVEGSPSLTQDESAPAYDAHGVGSGAVSLLQPELLTSSSVPISETVDIETPIIPVIEGGLHGVEMAAVPDYSSIDVSEPQLFGVAVSPATAIVVSEPQFYGVSLSPESEIHDEGNALPDDMTTATTPSNLPAEFIALSKIDVRCEGVSFDIPNDIPVSGDTTLVASVKKIPAEIPDDELTFEQFAVAGTVFENDTHVENLLIGGTYVFSLYATVGVIEEDIVSVVAGGIKACEGEGDRDGLISTIDGPADELTGSSVAVRGGRITVED